MKLVEVSRNLDCEASPLYRLQIKLKRLKQSLKAWNINCSGGIEDGQSSINYALEKGNPHAKNPPRENAISLEQAKRDYEAELQTKELFLRDKAKQSWSQADDKVLCCMHWGEQISNSFQIKDSENNQSDDAFLIKSKSVDYFESLFLSESIVEDEFIESIPTLVSRSDNSKLTAFPYF